MVDTPTGTDPAPPTLEGAEPIVQKWATWAAGFGLIPLPLVDFATTTGFSMKMLADLSTYFGVPFEREVGKSTIAALLGGAAAPAAGLGLLSLVKAIPVIGAPLAVMTGPVTCGGVTYAVGQVFATHFASGGTLLDFDVEAAREAFKQQVDAGKAFVQRKRAERTGGGPADGPVEAGDR